ncbi:MAG: hypothetical protein ACM3TN_12660 [Alphaproteobacteria bacterium]
MFDPKTMKVLQSMLGGQPGAAQQVLNGIAGATQAVGSILMDKAFPQIKTLELVLFYKMIYEVLMSYKTGFPGLEAASRDLRTHISNLERQAPQIRQALMTVLMQAGPEGAKHMLQDMRKQIPDELWWITAIHH